MTNRAAVARGGVLLGSAIHRPLSARDRDQLTGARNLPPYSVAAVGIAAPLALATAHRTLAPIRRPDRGWRIPFWVPRVPGSGASSADSIGGSPDKPCKGC